MYLDMGYSSMWSLLDKVPTGELKAEIPLLKEKSREINGQLNDLNRKHQRISANLSVLEEVIENRYMTELRDNFKLTDDHRKLVSNIYWHDKNPYHSLRIDDVVKILEWKKPNDEPSNEQIETAQKLLKEIPMALEEMTTPNKNKDK